MPDDKEMQKRAAQIDQDLQQADAKRRADAEAAAAGTEQILKMLAAISDKVTAVDQRMDALEAASAKAATDERSDKDASDETVVADGVDEPTGRALDAAMAKAQARADAVCGARGERAPPPMSGERLGAYRRRLLRNLRHESKEFGAIDLAGISGPVFDAVETRIYADALAASSRPSAAPGELREVKRQDQSGRWISEFYGDPKSWMNEFACQRQRVVRINTDVR